MIPSEDRKLFWENFYLFFSYYDDDAANKKHEFRFLKAQIFTSDDIEKLGNFDELKEILDISIFVHICPDFEDF